MPEYDISHFRIQLLRFVILIVECHDFLCEVPGDAVWSVWDGLGPSGTPFEMCSLSNGVSGAKAPQGCWEERERDHERPASVMGMAGSWGRARMREPRPVKGRATRSQMGS